MNNLQRFSKRNLKVSYLKNKNRIYFKDLDDICSRVSRQIYRGEYHISSVHKGVARGKNVYQVEKLRDLLVVEKVNDNLKRSYSVNLPNRESVVEQVIVLLKEKFPKQIIRLDVKSCFESVDARKLVQKINHDGYVSRETVSYLLQLIQCSEEAGAEGLPRGISVSSTLLEIALKEFDRAVRSLPGVYYYGRFVDDIIIFCNKEQVGVVKEVEKNLFNLGLRLNKTGDKYRIIETRHKEDSSVSSFSYLGYRFDLPLDFHKSKDLTVRISENKLNKVKTRLVRALMSYSIEKDFPLLRDRVRFLAGETPVYSEGGKKTRLRNGIAWSYKNINDYSQLVELDQFMCKLIYSKKGGFYKKYSSNLTWNEKHDLASISFYKCFFGGVLFNFSLHRLTSIMRAFRE